jgi:hypothetical protein
MSVANARDVPSGITNERPCGAGDHLAREGALDGEAVGEAHGQRHDELLPFAELSGQAQPARNIRCRHLSARATW